ncbi:PAS domain-containing sensor histidine kinase [Azospirillum halopraeferens]|uniref:sensor histidine kinase n=1 Tax=Azospirillum halopraeferens TaxID=34010 RepID=UPI000684F2C3|nr:PAS domain-containing sensor histidine kinase [Azospirillum halopraeferens]
MTSDPPDAMPENPAPEHPTDALPRAIVDGALDAILVMDADGRPVTVNAAAERILGFDRHAAAGRPVEELIVPPDGREAFRRAVATCPGPGGAVNGHRVETTCLRADGSAFPAEMTLTRTPVNGTPYVAIHLRDIGERKAQERALLEAKARAEAAARAKSVFLNTMSHELRTPLNAIIGFSELIRDGALGPLGDPKYGEFAADITEGARHLLGIINDVLAVSRIEAGEQRLMPETMDLGAVVRSCLQMVRDRAAKAGVTLVDDTGALPVGLHADRGAVMTILVTLLSNAVKFTPPGGEARIGVAMGSDGTLLLTVTDTGIGIPPDAVDRVFEPFHQLDAGPGRRYEGAGLGLTIARALMERHGGSIDLAGTPGGGTTATLRFPPVDR